MRRTILGALFALSGAAALCYEVAWTRHLVLVFGNTTRAVALLLGAYMLGLAIGSEVGGRLADRSRRPAVLYAVFEAAIAVFALAFPWLVDVVRSVYLATGTSAPPVLFALAFLLLLVPTFCMGTTLPLLARATVADPARTGRDIGFLYAMNIAGAVAGAAGTGLFLMEAAGVLGATRWAAAVNAAVGLGGWLYARNLAAPASGTDAPAEPTEQAAVAATGHVRAARLALVAAFASGFVGLAAQVAWTRLLTFFLQGFTWTFAAILSTFLLGLALGGAVFGRIASRSADPARLLGRLLVASGIACCAVLVALGRHYDVTRAASALASKVTQDLADAHRLMLVLASGAVLFLPAFVMGGVFPVAAALYQRGTSDLGRRVGRLYAVNTVGCVLGSLAAGFIGQPLLGPAWTAAAIGIVATAIGCVVLVSAAGRRAAVVVVAAGAACAVLVVAADPSRPWITRSHVFAGDRAREVRIVEERHGEVCTVSVVENDRERYSLLYTDEFEAAGTKPEYRYMRMLAHLPVALARDPSRTLVICFGTGTTAGSVSLHHAVKHLDIVEISPEVLAVSGRFDAVNHGVASGEPGRGGADAAVHVAVHVDDGRHFVLRSAEKWGVISLEPLMPYTPAAIHFYTRDFYEICRERLAPGGLVCQWIPLQGMSGDDFRQLVAAFVAVYPESAMFFVDGAVALIGGPDGVDLGWSRVASRLADPDVAADLAAVGFADPARALATFVSGGAKLREFVQGVEPCTDERPVLEFHPIPPGVPLPWLGQNLVHMRTLREQWERLPVDVTGAPDADGARDALYIALRAGNHVLDGMVHAETGNVLWLRRETQTAFEEYAAAREAFEKAVAVDPKDDTARRQRDGRQRAWWSLLGANALERRDFAAAARHFVRATEFAALRQADDAWTHLAEARNLAGDAPGALFAACEAVQRFPAGRDALAERAFARGALGDVEGAAIDYLRSARSDAVELLPERFRVDAERAWAAFPQWPQAFRSGGLDALPRVSVQDALADGVPGKVTKALRLAVARSDDPAGFDGQFAADVTPDCDALAEKDAVESLRRLRIARPGGAADAFVKWLSAPRPAAVLASAAEGLTDVDPARAAELLESARGTARVALARAAGRSSDHRLAMPLLECLKWVGPDEADLRRAAQASLFALTRGQAPHLSTLDVESAGSLAYANKLDDVESWLLREEMRADRER